MNFTSEQRNNRLILRLSGDLIIEAGGMPILQAAEAALDQQIRSCIVDISQLRYINSSGMGILITLLTKFRNRGGEVYLLNPSESVQRLLIITKLQSIFTVIRNEDEALV
jgi:anti-sigma B factor antagonist